MLLSLLNSFMNPLQFFFVAIDSQLVTCHDRTDTVFGKTGGMNAQFSENRQYGRIGTSVAFELDDDGIFKMDFGMVFEVLKTDVEINGEALCFFEVDKCDATKTIGNGGSELCKCMSGVEP